MSVIGLALLACCAAVPLLASVGSVLQVDATRSLVDRSVEWPTLQQWLRVLLLQDYNTRVVIFAAAVLGCAAGVVGSFTLLRRRALMGDALSHATLPGIAIAFMTASLLGTNAKSLPLLLGGATATGLVGVSTILCIRRYTRLKEDTALGIVLSVFFGAGVALLGVIQQMPGGHAAGLESFIFGKTASMGSTDATLITVVGLACIAICVAFLKEFKLLCFDEGFAGSRGYPVVSLDLALMSCVVAVSIVGLGAVGLVLVIALLIIPAAAARFWTESMWRMIVISAALGAISGLVGAAASALFPRLPSGAMIVLACAACFALSMLLGTSRGVLQRYLRRARLNRSIARQHLLRAVYEIAEHHPERCTESASYAEFEELMSMRSWSPRQLRNAIELAARAEWVTPLGDRVSLTKRGRVEAERLTREHRLWELYLIAYADIAPGRVDRQADRIEHVLEPEVVAELESMLDQNRRQVIASPHPAVDLAGVTTRESEPSSAQDAGDDRT